MKRVSFLIDGFNLYHSIKDLYRDQKVKAKWLNIHSLCQSYIQLFGKDAILHEVYYFSALANHLLLTHPDTVQRHKDFILCLEDTGIKVVLGRFKEKRLFCEYCKKTLLRHEEKETDVSIALKVFELFFSDECDILVIVSGDTDLTPAIKICKKYFSKKDICFCFPYKRKMKELANIATIPSFSIRRESYISHQFSDPYQLINGSIINKPKKW